MALPRQSFRLSLIHVCIVLESKVFFSLHRWWLSDLCLAFLFIHLCIFQCNLSGFLKSVIEQSRSSFVLGAAHFLTSVQTWTICANNFLSTTQDYFWIIPIDVTNLFVSHIDQVASANALSRTWPGWATQRREDAKPFGAPLNLRRPKYSRPSNHTTYNSTLRSKRFFPPWFQNSDWKASRHWIVPLEKQKEDPPCPVDWHAKFTDARGTSQGRNNWIQKSQEYLPSSTASKSDLVKISKCWT